MPTGYTQYVIEGADFKTFAQKCARAFGATIMQRDDTLDAPLITEYEPAPFYKENLEKAELVVKTLASLSDEEWQNKLNTSFEFELASYKESKARNNEKKEKLEAVLSDAKKWVPPTPEHIEIGKFMISQLEETIKFDCSFYDRMPEPKKQNLDTFRIEQLEDAGSSLARAKDNYQKEVERAAERSQWIQDFLKSL